MKILISYYSRTGATAKVALKIKATLESIEAIKTIEAISLRQNSLRQDNKGDNSSNIDIEAIKDTKNRLGALGYMSAGRDAMKNKLTELEPQKFNPSDYDLVIIGSPVWSFTLSAPARTYLAQNAGQFKKAAFFCTMGGRGAEKLFEEMEKTSGLKPETTLALTTKEVLQNNFQEKIDDFLKKIF